MHVYSDSRLSSTGMRVMLASMGAEEFALLHETCAQAGHLPIAYAYSRSMRPGQPADPYAVRMVAQVVEAVPGGVDLLIPAGPVGLREAMVGYRPDLLVVYGFNWILPPAVFRAPRFGAINIHPSLLPRYRGPAPVLWAIRNGDPEIGVSVHRIDEGVDTGPILAQRGGIPLADEVSRDGLRHQLVPVIRELLTTALVRAADGDPGEPQPEAGASHAGLIEPEFSRVDWSRPASEVHHQVRVFRFIGRSDAPVALVGTDWLRLVRTSLVPGNGQRMECGDGPIWIVESEPAPAPPVSGRPGVE